MGVSSGRERAAQVVGERARSEGLPVDADVDRLPGRVHTLAVADRVAHGDRGIAEGDAVDVHAERFRVAERLPVVGLGVDERQPPVSIGDHTLESNAALRQEGGVGVVEPLEEAREEDDARRVHFLEQHRPRLAEEGHGPRSMESGAPRRKREPRVARLAADGENPRVPRNDDPLRDVEDRFIDAVGGAIEFWGFRRVLGHVWGWLYLQGVPRTAPEIVSRLQLSKAAVSTSLAELEHWGCVRRFRRPGSRREMFEAEQDVWAMVSRVFRERELRKVQQVASTLDAVGNELKALAKKPGIARDEARTRLDRVQGLGDLAQFATVAIQGFLDQGLADVRPLKGD